jgi:hypothetical protein
MMFQNYRLFFEKLKKNLQIFSVNSKNLTLMVDDIV